MKKIFNAENFTTLGIVIVAVLVASFIAPMIAGPINQIRAKLGMS